MNAPLASSKRSKRPFVFAGLAILGVLVAVVLVVFQPQKLFIDDKVNEALPGLPSAVETPTGDGAAPSSAPGDGETTTAAAAEPVIDSRHPFRSLEHGATGDALVVTLADGSRIVRFEALDTDNGPDLRVILSKADVSSDAGAFTDTEWVELGELKGNIGDQNYEISADIDLSEYRSVAVWCKRFNSTFAAASIVP